MSAEPALNRRERFRRPIAFEAADHVTDEQFERVRASLAQMYLSLTGTGLREGWLVEVDTKEGPIVTTPEAAAAMGLLPREKGGDGSAGAEASGSLRRPPQTPGADQAGADGPGGSPAQAGNLRGQPQTPASRGVSSSRLERSNDHRPELETSQAGD